MSCSGECVFDWGSISQLTFIAEDKSIVTKGYKVDSKIVIGKVQVLAILTLPR
mgnify:CR=1 FL=1